MRVLSALLDRPKLARSGLFSPWDLEWFSLGGQSYLAGMGQSLRRNQETIENHFAGYVEGAYKQGGVVASVMLARLLTLGQIRFLFQDVQDGRPGDFHDRPRLDILRRPWPGGTTQNLLAKMEQHAGLAGNAYVTRRGDRLKVLRPDWVTIVRASRDDVANPLDADLIGYLYQEGGPYSGSDPVMLDADAVAHYAPLPDPIAEFRGMSWVTPVLRAVSAHRAAETHKWKFFENGATPNMVVKFDARVVKEQVEAFKDIFLDEHTGVMNAYKTMFLGGGADAEVVGMDFKQLDFKRVQGADETLVASAAGVPPIIANLSEGLEASTYSNYGQAKRHFADTTVTFLAGEAASSLETIVPSPTGMRLWFDTSDVPFFRDDAKSEAEVSQAEASMIRNLTDGGFSPISVINAVSSGGNWKLLEHSGTVPVQQHPLDGSVVDEAPPEDEGDSE